MPGRGWITAGELDCAARELVRRWDGAPLAGRIVLMALPNSPEWLASFAALSLRSAIVAAADPSTPAALLPALAQNARAAFLLTPGGVLTPVAGRTRRFPEEGPALAKITSGSTGLPKALLFRAEEMIADGRSVIEAMGITSDDVSYALVPFGHSYGLGNLVMPLLLQGTAAACSSSPLPRLAVRDMMEAGVTVCPGVPSFFRAMNETELDAFPRSLRLSLSAGSALPAAVAADYACRRGQPIHNFLGSSETGGIAWDTDGSAALSGTTVGRPMPRVTIFRGRGGRLGVAGPAVFSIGNRLRRGGNSAFLLGDRGHVDAAGSLVLEGRVRPLAKIGGRRVDPLEVEGVLRRLPGVTDAAVRVSQAAGCDRLHALVETALEPAALREKLRALLPEWKIPRRFLCLAAFPRDDRGKIKRSEVDRLLNI